MNELDRILDEIRSNKENGFSIDESSYTTDNEKYNIFISEYDDFIDIELVDNETAEIIAKDDAMLTEDWEDVKISLEYLLKQQVKEEIIQFDKSKCQYKQDSYNENCQWRTCNVECYS